MKKMFGMMAAMVAMVGMLMGACSFGSVYKMSGDMKYTAEDLRPKAFKEIDVDVVADVYYTQNDSGAHHVRFDYSAIDDANLVRDLKEKVKAVYRNGGLEIGQQGSIEAKNSMGKGKRLKIYITSSDLVKIGMEGVGSFQADSINTDRLDVDNVGVGSVSIRRLMANKVKVDNEGVGSVTVGKFIGDELKITNDGVGSVSADVDCQAVDASLDGVGSLKLSGITRRYTKSKDGVGSFKDKTLRVMDK